MTERPPGPRGELTRQRLLDATRTLLKEKGFRALRVADIARLAGTSAATFYNYFGDVEAALLALMTSVVAEAETRLASPIGQPPWTLATITADAEHLAGEFLGFWADHHDLISVVDLRAAEGVGALKGVRAQLLTGVSNALENTYRDRGHGDAKARAFVHVAMLANVAAHQQGMIAAGVSRNDLVSGLASQLAQDF